MSRPIARSTRKTPGTKASVKRVVKRVVKRGVESDPKPAAEASPAPRASKNILTAGIKALTNAHEEAVARQSRVFESLLGLGARREATTEKSAAPLAATTLDPFGFKKFEDVFDQRVARAMGHIGVPTAEAFAELKAEVESLRATVARLEAAGRKR